MASSAPLNCFVTLERVKPFHGAASGNPLLPGACVSLSPERQRFAAAHTGRRRPVSRPGGFEGQ